METRNLVPLKVIIGLKGKEWPIAEERGQALYPAFNTLPAVVASGLDWSKYVDEHGESWHYDKTCGHKDHGTDSPRGTQNGMLLVPEDFANQAVTAFPGIVTRITATEAEAFYDNKAHAHESEEEIDTSVLAAIQAKQSVGAALTQEQEDALDPAKEQRGIRKNHRRKLADYKAKKGFKIV